MNELRYQRLPRGFKGDFEALREPEGWVGQVASLLRAGVVQAGTVGVACPNCYRAVTPSDCIHPDNMEVCRCPDGERDSMIRIVNALGIPARLVATATGGFGTVV